MGKMSKAAEAKLMAAIEKTAELVNAGTPPSAAIAKAAAATGVPAGHVNQLVYAYNTGQTNRQRLEGDTPLEKAAEFPLADAETVLELMYPKQVKTAAAVRQSTAVSTEYALSPHGILHRRAAQEKRAQHVDWTLGGVKEGPGPYPGDPKERVKKASAAVDRLQREVNEQRREAAAAFDKMGHTFCDLTDYFRRPGCVPIPIVKENVMLLHGDKAEQIMDQLIRVTPGLAKMANQRPVRSARDLSARGAPYDLIQQLVGEIRLYKEAKSRYLATAEQAEKQAGVLLSPFAVPSPSRSVLGDAPSSTEKRAWGFQPWSIYDKPTSTVLRSLNGVAEGLSDPGGNVQQDYNALTDPEHEQELRDIKTEAMLQFLMQNDEEISGHEPDEVLGAFNEIVDAVPRAADQMLLMRTLLKKRLKGELDTHEIDQMLGMGEKLRSRDEASQSELKERELGQSTQQFREKQKLEAERFIHEQERFKKEHKLHSEQFKAEKSQFGKTHTLEEQKRKDQVARDSVLRDLEERKHLESQVSNVNREDQAAAEFVHKQFVEGHRLGQTDQQIEETLRHNGAAEGFTEKQLTEAARHNERTEGQTDTGHGIQHDTLTESKRHNEKGEGMQEAGLTGTYSGAPTMAARHHTDQMDATQATLEQQQQQHEDKQRLQADIARGAVTGGPTLQSQQFTYQKGRDTAEDAADLARAQQARDKLDVQNYHAELAHIKEQDKAEAAAKSTGQSYTREPYIPETPAVGKPTPFKSVLPP